MVNVMLAGGISMALALLCTPLSIRYLVRHSYGQFIMGDTGSLSLGAALAGLAILTHTQLLLILLGALFVIITASVIIQVISFKLTGKRVFRMAPLHHHSSCSGGPR